jgi:hypothetical protein
MLPAGRAKRRGIGAEIVNAMGFGKAVPLIRSGKAWVSTPAAANERLFRPLHLAHFHT